MRWSTPVRRETGKQFHSDPLITHDLVVVGTDSSEGGGVHAFETSTGRERWFYPSSHGVAAAISSLGPWIYAATLDGEVLSLEIDSGKRRWTQPLRTLGWAGPIAADGRVYVGTDDGFLYALNAETGQVEWKTELGKPVTTSVCASSNSLYVGTVDEKIYRVDSRTGKVLASRQLDQNLVPTGVPIAANNSLLVLLADKNQDDRAIVSLDVALDRVRWQQAAKDHWSTSRLFAFSNSVLVGAPSGKLAAYCIGDGSLVWSTTLNGAIRVIGGFDHTLYVGTTGGRLTALEALVSCKNP